MNDERTSVKGDNFKRIKGIGPATERRLHSAGILTYAQLAASTPKALADLLSGLVGMSEERVVEEAWLAKAEALAQEQETAVAGNGQHYATFTVELLLDQQNDVRRTRIVHVQQQEQHKETWAGWREKRLVQFIAQHAGLAAAPAAASAVIPPETAAAPPAPSPPTPNIPTAPPTPARKKPAGQAASLQLDPVDEKRMVFVDPQPAAQATPPAPTPKATPEASAAPAPAAKRPLTINSPHGLLAHDHGFDVQLHFDPSHLSSEHHRPFRYRAAVFVKKAGNGQRRQVGAVQGAITETSKTLVVSVPTNIQDPGTYRLEAEMSLLWQPSTTDWTTAAKGAMLHVY